MVASPKQCFTDDYLWFFFLSGVEIYDKSFMVYMRIPHTTFCFICRKSEISGLQCRPYTIALIYKKIKEDIKEKAGMINQNLVFQLVI